MFIDAVNTSSVNQVCVVMDGLLIQNSNKLCIGISKYVIKYVIIREWFIFLYSCGLCGEGIEPEI